MRSSEQLNELATALCAAQGQFQAVGKDSENPFFKSRYAGLPAVVKAATPILSEHGLSVAQLIGRDESGGDTLTTVLMHKSGQFLSDTMRLHLVKDDPQGQGSATTYARRYAYMAVLGLVADEDDDGNAASGPREQKPAPTNRREQHGTVRPSPARAPAADTGELASEKQVKAIFAIAKQKGFSPDAGWLSEMARRQVSRAEDLSKREASDAIKALNDLNVEAATARVAEAFDYDDGEPF